MTVTLAKWGASGVIGSGVEISDDPLTAKAKKEAISRAKIQAAIYLTLPGLPFIYYGEELGMTGRRYKNDDIARRDAYPWGDSDPLGDTTFWSKKTVMLEDGQNKATPGYKAQDTDPESLLNIYRKLAALRKERTALKSLSFAICPWADSNKGSLISYFRENESGREKILVTINAGRETQIIILPIGQKLELLMDSGSTPEISESTINLSAGSFAIWLLPQE